MISCNNKPKLSLHNEGKKVAMNNFITRMSLNKSEKETLEQSCNISMQIDNLSCPYEEHL